MKQWYFELEETVSKCAQSRLNEDKVADSHLYRRQIECEHKFIRIDRSLVGKTDYAEVTLDDAAEVGNGKERRRTNPVSAINDHEDISRLQFLLGGVLLIYSLTYGEVS